MGCVHYNKKRFLVVESAFYDFLIVTTVLLPYLTGSMPSSKAVLAKSVASPMPPETTVSLNRSGHSYDQNEVILTAPF